MNNNYVKDIRLPINFIPHKFLVSKQYHELMLTPDLINQEFHLWLKDLGLKTCSIGSRFFYRHSLNRGTIHVDAFDLNASKLLFIYDSKGAIMNWYDLLPGKTPTTFITQNGEVIRSFDPKNCTKILTTPADSHCLINGKIMHQVVVGLNNFQYRKCYSITLLNYQTNERIHWDRAIEIFKPYFVNDM
jgi:hypothetical protein